MLELENKAAAEKSWPQFAISTLDKNVIWERENGLRLCKKARGYSSAKYFRKTITL